MLLFTIVFDDGTDEKMAKCYFEMASKQKSKENEMNVYEIPGKLTVTWNAEVKAIIDTWTSYSVSLEEFRKAVLEKGLDYGKERGVQAWIVDSSSAKGVFQPEIQEFIGSDVFPMFGSIGVKHFITISSQVSALTNMTVKTYASKTGPNGLQLVELNSTADAIMWLQHNAQSA